MAELTYTKVGDYYIPDLILDENPAAEKLYGKYGDLRRTYLRERKPKLWMVLVNTGRAAHGYALVGFFTRRLRFMRNRLKSFLQN